MKVTDLQLRWDEQRRWLIQRSAMKVKMETFSVQRMRVQVEVSNDELDNDEWPLENALNINACTHAQGNHGQTSVATHMHAHGIIRQQ